MKCKVTKYEAIKFEIENFHPYPSPLDISSSLLGTAKTEQSLS
jgi:hypothetical protein